MEVANEWSCRVISNYQVGQNEELFNCSVFLNQSSMSQSLQTNHLTLSAVTKVSPIMESTAIVNWDKQVSLERVTDSWQGTMAYPPTFQVGK